MSLNMNSMCRLCLSQEGTTYIFQDVMVQKNIVSLSKRIMTCVQVEVLEGDGLPTSICLLCLQQVEKFSVFREMCINSDSTLRQYLRDLIIASDVSHKFVVTSDISLISYHVDQDLHNYGTEKNKIYCDQSIADVCKSFENNMESNLQSAMPLDCVDMQSIENIQSTSYETVSENHCVSSDLEDKSINEHEGNRFSHVDEIKNTVSEVHELIKDELMNKHEDRGVIIPVTGLIKDMIPNSNKTIVTSNLHNCPVCSKTFSKKVYLKRHAVIHSGKKPYSCKQCGNSFSRTGDLAKHMRKHPSKLLSSMEAAPNGNDGANNENVTCNVCFREFSKPYYLKQHLVVHSATNSSSFLCDQCGKSFQHRSALTQHKVTHIESVKYSCKACSKKFASTRRLKDHMRLHEGSKQYLCNVCGKSFGSKDGLLDHERTHSGDKPFACAMCNKQFATSSNYRTHMKHHTLGKSFPCAQCDMSFFTKSGLERHDRLHTGYKPFPCEVCGVSFYTKREMLRHKAYHLGNKRFACDKCNKSYFESQHLIIHQRSHSGERPFPCTRCKKSFSDGSKLKRHEQTHMKD